MYVTGYNYETVGKYMRFLQRLDYIRMAVGICLVVDGTPITYFFRDTLGLAPGSTAFTAAIQALGFLLMIPFSVLRRLYRPNITLFQFAMGFLVLTSLYMFFYNTDRTDINRDMIYYAYILIFLFLLINIPNDFLEEIVPVIILFTILSNLALIYSLVKDPFWTVGQRAAIMMGTGGADDRSGNPHIVAKSALMGVIASLVWAFRVRTSLPVRVFCLLNALFSAAIMALTQTRSSILAGLLMLVAFAYFHIRPTHIRSAGRALMRPSSIIAIVLLFVGLNFALNRSGDLYAILYGYVVGFIERNTENVYALLGLKSSGAAYVATLDDSAVNRTFSAQFLRNVLIGHINIIVLGAGFKSYYLDIPVVEALISHGILGFFLYAGFNVIALYHALNAIRVNAHPFSSFLGYFYLYIFVLMFTNGRPYDPYTWFPYCLMIRFLGVEHLLPERLRSPNI